MRAGAIVRIAFGLLIILSTGARATENLVSISLSGPQSSIELGRPILIRVSAENISDRSLHATRVDARGDGSADFDVLVRDHNGRPVPHSARGKLIYNEPGAGC